MEMPETVEMQPVRTIPIPVAQVEMAAPVSTAAAERSITTAAPLPVEMQEMAAAPKRAMEEPEEMVVPAPLERRTIRMAEQRPEETAETAVTPTMEEATETAAPVVKVLRERSIEEIRMVITARMVKSSS